MPFLQILQKGNIGKKAAGYTFPGSLNDLEKIRPPISQ